MRYLILLALCASLVGGDVILSTEHLSDAIWLDALLADDSITATVSINDSRIRIALAQSFDSALGYDVVARIVSSILASMVYADWPCDSCLIQFEDIQMGIPFTAIQRADTLTDAGFSPIYVVNELLANATITLRLP